MIVFQLHNETDMVFSATPATEGGHHALGYVPGQAIWGAFAARVYADAKHKARAFDLVHSGKVRFSPAYPATEGGEPAFPWPQCLQHPKHEGATRDGNHLRRPVWNTLNGSLARQGTRVQTEAPKARFISTAGVIARSVRGERGKSAIGAGDRRVANAQFFQYEHLREGATWISWVEADNLDDERLAADLLGRAPIRLGRSKRREYGGAVTVAELGSAVSIGMAGSAGGREVVLWCLSDLAILDRNGMPNLAPEGSDLGIAGFSGTLSRTVSLISTRRFAPYNTYLRARDREMTVIEAGSVLVYSTDVPVPTAAFAQGVGQWRERGLGRVLVNPPLLDRAATWPRDVYWAASKANQHAEPAVGTTLEANTALLAMLSVRASRHTDAKRIADAAQAIAARLERDQRGASLTGNEVPAASQWSRVADVVIEAAGVDDLVTLLFDEEECRRKKTRAICAGPGTREWEPLRAPLRRLIQARTGVPPEEDRRDVIFTAALAQACRQVARNARKERQ